MVSLKVQLLQLESRTQRVTNDVQLGTAQDPTNAAVLPSPTRHAKEEKSKIIEAAIPVCAFLIGKLLLVLRQTTPGMLAIYFGGQSSFSLYMKLVLSGELVSQELKLRGMPAAFLVTAVQQVVAFLALGVAMLLLFFTPWRYVPRPLTSWREFAVIVLFSAAVAVNIGLNNFSMSLLPVSLNLVIRSCIPLVTLVLQVLGKNIWPKVFETKAGLLDVSLMTAGVLFAAIAALAESESQQPRNHESHILLGVMMCFLSDIAAAMTLILASAFTSALDPPLGPMDTIFYMALPCALILLPASMYAVHPVNWPGFGPLTDWQVMSEVMSLSPYVALYVVASGVISAGYNFIQYTVVQSLSANHAAFAGNFNKAATISLSICFGLEVLPGGMWSPVMLLGIVGNICSFTVWSYLQSGGARPPKPA